jgi:heme-degrading monooxygenase HmoA
MILEHALIPVKSGQSKEFEAAFVKARKFIEAAEGFQKLEMRGCIERADNYLLLVWWTSVDAHMKGFRGSDAFLQWRGMLGPFFAAPPEVHHYQAPLAPR